uniref:Galanin receptor 1 n=1 Tax=Anas platyrhynchos TaxID=8839 RepID=A0A8B9ST20_ANAPL
MDAGEPFNQSRAGAEPPRGDLNLSGLLEAGAKPLFGMGIENFITLIVFFLIFALGVLGNSLVITVLARSKPGKRRSTTNIFILNLSIADLAYLLFCIPFQSTVYVLPDLGAGRLHLQVHPLLLHRLHAGEHLHALGHVRGPLRGHRALPPLLNLALSPRLFHSEKSNQTFCWEHWPNPRHKKVYVVCTFIFGYLLPLLLISFCYAKVLNHLHKKLRNMSKKSEASKKKTAQTVLVVVVVFGISWLPHHVIHLWAEFGVFPLTQASFIFRIIAHCLAYSNSSVNPIIYAFLSENFRKAYKQVFKCQIGNESPLNDAKENKSQIDTPPTTNCTHV